MPQYQCMYLIPSEQYEKFKKSHQKIIGGDELSGTVQGHGQVNHIEIGEGGKVTIKPNRAVQAHHSIDKNSTKKPSFAKRTHNAEKFREEQIIENKSPSRDILPVRRIEHVTQGPGVSVRHGLNYNGNPIAHSNHHEIPLDNAEITQNNPIGVQIPGTNERDENDNLTYDVRSDVSMATPDPNEPATFDDYTWDDYGERRLISVPQSNDMTNFNFDSDDEQMDDFNDTPAVITGDRSVPAVSSESTTAIEHNKPMEIEEMDRALPLTDTTAKKSLTHSNKNHPVASTAPREVVPTVTQTDENQDRTVAQTINERQILPTNNERSLDTLNTETQVVPANTERRVDVANNDPSIYEPSSSDESEVENNRRNVKRLVTTQMKAISNENNVKPLSLSNAIQYTVPRVARQNVIRGLARAELNNRNASFPIHPYRVLEITNDTQRRQDRRIRGAIMRDLEERDETSSNGLPAIPSNGLPPIQMESSEKNKERESSTGAIAKNKTKKPSKPKIKVKFVSTPQHGKIIDLPKRKSKKQKKLVQQIVEQRLSELQGQSNRKSSNDVPPTPKENSDALKNTPKKSPRGKKRTVRETNYVPGEEELVERRAGLRKKMQRTY